MMGLLFRKTGVTGVEPHQIVGTVDGFNRCVDGIAGAFAQVKKQLLSGRLFDARHRERHLRKRDGLTALHSDSPERGTPLAV